MAEDLDAKPKTAEELKREKEQKEAELAAKIAKDVRGVLYVKTVWMDEGPEMPPIHAEDLLNRHGHVKVRKELDEEEQRRLLLKQLYIDVNDPRNEKIIKWLREMKNDFLVKLLEQDAKNPLFDVNSFRHQLLRARNTNYDLAKKPIPMLEREIIDAARDDGYYLTQLMAIIAEHEALKNVNKQQTVLQEYMDQNIEEGMRDRENKVMLTFDTDTIRRRRIFFENLKRFQKNFRSGSSKAQTSFKSVVSEFYMEERKSIFAVLFNTVFQQGRKLKPLIRDPPKKSPEQVGDATLMVHVIKGYNVPLRASASKEMNRIQKLKQAMQQSDFGGERGTLKVPQQPGMPPQASQFSMAYGGGNMQDMRASGAMPGSLGQSMQ